jgi:hypothetical protein
MAYLRTSQDGWIHLSKEADKAGGTDSLWVLERFIWPINPQTLYSGTSVGKFPQIGSTYLTTRNTYLCCCEYREILSNKYTIPITILINILNPVILAKRFATLDVLSNGNYLASVFFRFTSLLIIHLSSNDFIMSSSSLTSDSTDSLFPSFSSLV